MSKKERRQSPRERPMLWMLPVLIAGLASLPWLVPELLPGGGLPGEGLPDEGLSGETASCVAAPPDEVAIEAGVYTMGAAGLHPEEGPPELQRVHAFFIDATEVTNRQFAEFVSATGYITLSERNPDPALYRGVPAHLLQPSSLVFVGVSTPPRQVWQVVAGANWRHPEGPNSSIEEKMERPVVHVGYEDALAYALWKGRDLPTEIEWEYAARGGLDGAVYEWGDEEPDHSAPPANYWQGSFPREDRGADGYPVDTAPVGCFAANGYGLYDMSGNVWEWTKTSIEDEQSPAAADVADADDGGLPRHIIKGGSFLCADNYCHRYRPAARQKGPSDTGASHIGFRTVRREADQH